MLAVLYDSLVLNGISLTAVCTTKRYDMSIIGHLDSRLSARFAVANSCSCTHSVLLSTHLVLFWEIMNGGGIPYTILANSW